MDKPRLNNYPAGVPATKYDQYSSIVQLLEESFQKYAHRAAFNSMGKNVTYGEVDELSARSAPTCKAWACSRATASPA